MVSARDLTKTELVSILEFIEDSRRCKNPDDMRRLLMRAAETLGAERSVCGVGRFTEIGMGEAEAVISADYPDEWLRMYLKEGLYRHDPVILHHIRFSPPTLWRDIRERYNEDELARFVVGTASDFGLRDGISCSVLAPQGDRISIFSFSGANSRFGIHQKCILDAITLHLNSALHRSLHCGEDGPGAAVA